MAPSLRSSSLFKPPRKASVIVPFTGERVHIRQNYGTTGRNFTLQIPESNPTTRAPSPVTESSSLLGQSHTSYAVSGVNGSNGDEDGQVSGLTSLWSTIYAAKGLLASKNAKMIVKCTLAYFLGSLATFVAPIAGFLGKSDGKHLVATFAVYFHPARTMGSMFEAIIYAFTALFYSNFISISSMFTARFFGSHDMLGLGHAIILIVFCSGGLGYIGWIKQKMASPTVSTACSLASIACITILTKEGHIQEGQFSLSKIIQVTTMLVMAITASIVVSFTIWPSSAREELLKSMVKSTDSFSTMLSILTSSFLTGSEDLLSCQIYLEACANHRSVFTMSRHLMEAKYEHYLNGTERQYHLESKLVDCMQKLAQHIGGLQSASKSQHNLLREGLDTLSSHPFIVTPQSAEAGPSNIFAPSNAQSAPVSATDNATTPVGVANIDPIIQEHAGTPIGIFEQFIYHLGPPMKSLVYTLKIMLDNLPASPGSRSLITVNPRFRESLLKATELYSEARAEALDTLYKGLRVPSSRDQKAEWAADVEEVAGCCGYFSYCLQAFSQEVLIFLDILERMEDYQNNPQRSWNWLKIWKLFGTKNSSSGDSEAPTSPILPDMLKLHNPAKTIPNIAKDQPVPFSYRIWKALKLFRRDDIKFGIKVGSGAAIYALPAFIDSTRPIFAHWRGEWGLVSYMIVMSMTIGQTNSSGLLRVLGTIIGAALTVLAWIIFPRNPYALSFFGCLIAMPCFHIILNWKQNTFGRFILLTYNLSCLYAYSLSIKDDDDDGDDEGGINPIITEIAFHRLVSVTVGVTWGIFINRYVWPISARTKLRRGLSVLWFRMALIWKRDPLLSTIHGSPEKKYMSITEERALQRALLRLSSLTAQAPNEYRLKGPFPTASYQKLISVNQSILDACHGMSMIITADPQANERERDILEYTATERNNLCARISHLFYVLASSIRLGFPLPESLPSTEKARDRLLAKLWEYKLERVRGEEGRCDEDFANMYAYVLMIGRITEGLHECIQTLNGLYGVLEEEMLEI